jgi:hypothetical protein
MWIWIQIDPKWKSNASQKWPRVSTERSLFYARKERPHQKDLGAQMEIKFLPIWPEMVLRIWIWVQMDPKWKSNASQKLPRWSTERSLFYARKERPHQKNLGAQMDIKFLPIWPEMVLQTWIWVQMEPKWKSNASQKLPRGSTERSLFYARKERPHQEDLGTQMEPKFLPIGP